MKEVTGLHLRVDGTYELFTYDAEDSLDVLQEKVGGWLEVAPIADPMLTMYCHEEGKILMLPFNMLASELLPPENQDVIMGDVVITGAADPYGYDTSLPVSLIELIQRGAPYKRKS